MIEGFWIVQFEGMQGAGGGVAVLTKGRVFGGDSGSIYLGDYQDQGVTFKARVRIHNYMPGVNSIIGIEGDYDLDVTGTIEGGLITASGSALGHQSAGMALRLTKAADLPV